MKYKKNKRYRLFDYEPRCGMIYIKVENGQIYFYNCRDYWEDDKKKEIKWIEQGFTDCNLLFRSDESTSNRDFCYLILKDNTGNACIMEIVSKEVILKDINNDSRLIFKGEEKKTAHKFCYMLFKENDGKAYVMEIFSRDVILKDVDYKDVKSVKQRTLFPKDWGMIDEEERKDAALVIWNKRQKLYSIFSIKEGYIYGPNNYSEIEEFVSGVIIDEHLAIENDGYIFDFAGYERDGNVYFNKDKDDYRFFLDDADGMFYIMEKDQYTNDDVVKLEIEDNNGTIIYKYNKETGEFTQDYIPDDDGYQYTERDTWWALTDGQYGDYPEDGVDWDRLSDSMGL